MKRLLINSVLLMVFSGFLLAPNYPYLHYFLAQKQVVISNADVTVENSKTLIGDIAYLSAIINRAGDPESKTKKETPPPETNNNYSQLVYDIPSGIAFHKPQNTVCKYNNEKQYFLKTVYIKIPSPPPENFS
jgi:hypothetical protein